ncbi:hypothetical protein [Sphingobium yanoikuyae]|uniref:hypothetical protein n=1 Tax=Sphingobium yanoikuyae TaxID=13690 RepID=UPI00068EFA76|nr:hypothetical protein [Sphingobium yanoikuyae]MDV3479778.1 hypothetical protein [Sphingobium yanoikuyae]
MKRIGWLLLGVMAPQPGQAQEAAPMAEARAAIETADLAALPPEVRAAIGRAYSVSEILQIRGVEKVPGQTLAVDELIFKPDGMIEFIGQHPWVLLFAKRMRIEDPQSLLGIRRNAALLAGPKGHAGQTGTHGARGGRRGSDGEPGRPGGRGTNGGPGATARVPDLYIVAGRLEATATGSPLSQVRMNIDFRGVPGGPGGAGGSGGAGGDGGGGRNGRAGPFGDCRRGADDGGDGGRGGPGGNGGAGANGGDGGAVYVIGPAAVTDIFTAGDILTGGGAGGRGGAAGPGGQGGARGSRGSQPGTCHGAHPGDVGATGPRGQVGPDAQPGARGRVFAVRIGGLDMLQAPPSP